MEREMYSERYRGHLSLPGVGEEGQCRLCQGRVLVVGAGGLASAVVLYLAAAGVGTIVIADADTVSLSNLQRQIMHTNDTLGIPKVESARIAAECRNPSVRVVTYQEYLTEENADTLLAGCDIVADCTDSRNSRVLVSRLCIARGLPYVFASVRGYEGLLFTSLPGTTGYEDFFTQADAAGAVPCSEAGILNTLVGVMGSLQATEVIKYLTATGQLLTNRLLHVDLLTMTFTVL